MLPTDVFDLELNDTSLFGMFEKINSFTDVGQGGMLGIFILLVVGGVLFMMMKDRTPDKSNALSVTMLVTSLVGLILRVLHLIGDFVFYICVVLFVVGIIFMMKDSEKYEQ